MCLSIAVNNPSRILSKGEHLGFEWIVTHNGSGYRCGYVRVPKGHPWHGIDYSQVRNAQGEWPDTHGELTFSEADVSCGKGEDDAHWFGFDCAHYCDAPDPSLPSDRMSYVSSLCDGEIRTTEYVESYCRRLAEQAAEVAASH